MMIVEDFLKLVNECPEDDWTIRFRITNYVEGCWPAYCGVKILNVIDGFNDSHICKTREIIFTQADEDEINWSKQKFIEFFTNNLMWNDELHFTVETTDCNSVANILISASVSLEFGDLGYSDKQMVIFLKTK